MTLLDKITALGNSIIALNNTRADKSFSNINDTAKGVIQSYASGAGIPKETLNNMLITNSLTALTVSEANKRFCFANADASKFVYANSIKSPTALMNADGTSYTGTDFTLSGGKIMAGTAAAIRYSTNDSFGVATVTSTGSVKYSYNNTDKTVSISGTSSATNVHGTKYIAVGNSGKTVGKYTVAYTAPSNAASGDLWYDLSTPVLKKFTTSWAAFDGTIVGKMTRNAEGNLVIEKLPGYRMLDATTVLNEVTTAKVPVGTVISFMGTEEPEGFLLMDGRELLISDYPELYSVIGNTQGTPSDSNHFCIADMTDGRYLMGSTVAGGRIAENLPDIIGSWIPSQGDNGGTGLYFGNRSNRSEEGALYNISVPTKQVVSTETGGTWEAAKLGFAASKSNAKYTDLDRVYPLSETCNYLVKY